MNKLNLEDKFKGLYKLKLQIQSLEFKQEKDIVIKNELFKNIKSNAQIISSLKVELLNQI